MASDTDGERKQESGQQRLLETLRKSAPYLLIVLPLFLLLHAWGISTPLAVTGCLLLFILVIALVFFSTPKPVAVMVKTGKHEGPLSRLSGERLADFLPDPLVLFDAEGTILYVNHAAREAFPPLARDASLYLCFRSPEMHSLIQGIIADGQARSSDYLERLPFERWYRASVMTFETAKGEADCFILIFRDQTELRRIDRMRSDFIANASHELRTPLASLRGFIETLQGPARDDAAARERFLGIMQTQADRMSRLIDDLLSLSRLEMKAAIPVKERIDIGQVLSHVVETLAPMATGVGVVIEWAKPDHPVWLPGDKDELIQVFQNLIENACKYGQAGKRVIVSLDEQGGEVVSTTADALRGFSVSVEDFGPGIPAEHLPRLTERFYRVDVDSSRAHKGTGLGLAIVKHILTRHRGRLIVRSQLGKGAVFTVVFAGS
ncbi:ATP-binding protein [Ochrobactrum sp. SFR4]|uniref:ATP-binding protein n=1 Tax=Ochrobactrum sp. SFR4 TaxID=2717368 RepID=UPI001C8C0566|nr:two-component sensor histidine kinase [Ochrobactrum sp. SFR4]